MKGTKEKKPVAGIITVAVVTLLVLVYVSISIYYRIHFYPNTRIGEQDISGLTIEKATNCIDKELLNYELSIVERDGKIEAINGQKIEVKPDYGDRLEQALASQNGFSWPKYLVEKQQIQSLPMVYNEELLSSEVEKLECGKDENQIAPQDAYLQYKNGVYEVVPEVRGTTIDKTKIKNIIADEVEKMSGEADLEKLGCYVNPVITKDSETLLESLEKANGYLNANITYEDGGVTVSCGKEEIKKMLRFNKEGKVSIDEKKIDEFVEKIHQSFSTYGKSKEFKTSYGKTITVTRGDYGWLVNKEKEKKYIRKAIQNKKVETRRPEYTKRAASRGKNEYGNTYVEINLTAQHLFVYVDGKKVLESDFVSGNEAAGTQTRLGMSSLKYKQTGATLRGEDYETFVNYWMPFDGGIGMHDATWRSKFGGDIYKTKGSHGCINLPLSVAKKIYEYVQPGEPIVVYKLPGTEPKIEETKDKVDSKKNKVSEE